MPKRRRDLRPSRSSYKRRRTYKRAKRRTYKKRRSRTLMIPKIFPDKAVVKHKYVCRGKLEALGLTRHAIFRANGMYDPEVALGGHQPMMFDQLSAMYDHYTVVGAKIKVKCWVDANQNSDTDPIAVSLQLADSPQAPLSAYTVREQPNTAYTTLIQNGTPYTLTKGFSAKKFFGKKIVVGEAELRGTINANPSEGAFFVISAGCMEAEMDNEADPISPVHYEIEIQYSSVWTERKPLATS